MLQLRRRALAPFPFLPPLPPLGSQGRVEIDAYMGPGAEVSVTGLYVEAE